MSSSEIKRFGYEHIVIDQREKLPLCFMNASKKFLIYGDYSLKGLENQIGIERKSLDDFVRSITGENRKKFESNILKAKANLKYYAIVIEADYLDLKDSSNWFGNTEPSVVVGTAIKWSVKHNIPIFFAHDRNGCAEIVKGLLEGFRYYF